jgi:hypothetical protein
VRSKLLIDVEKQRWPAAERTRGVYPICSGLSRLSGTTGP